MYIGLSVGLICFSAEDTFSSIVGEMIRKSSGQSSLFYNECYFYNILTHSYLFFVDNDSFWVVHVVIT